MAKWDELAKWHELMSRVVRINSSPIKIEKLVRDLLIAGEQSRLSRLSDAERASRRAVADGSQQTMNDVTVMLTNGTIPFRELIATLMRSISADTFASVSTENVYRISPFLELGNILVAESEVDKRMPDATRLHQLLTPLGSQGQTKFPMVPERAHSRGHTYWAYASWNWGMVPLVVVWYHASTRATVSGWDAADILGGEYASAKNVCETLVVEDFATALIKAAACQYAQNTPEVRFVAPKIYTKVCGISCDAIADQGFNCRDHTGEHTSGPVEVTHYAPIWYSGMHSQHVVFIDDVNRIELQGNC
jgi:hypothetical protein